MSLFQLRQTVLLLITATIWGLSFVAQSVGMDHVGPFTFTASRMFLGALVSLPFVLWNRSRLAASNPAEHARRTSLAYMKMLLLGGAACGLCLFGGESLQQFGLVHDTEVGKAGFITALYIVLVPMIGLALGRRTGSARLGGRGGRDRRALVSLRAARRLFGEARGPLHAAVRLRLLASHPRHLALRHEGQRRRARLRTVRLRLDHRLGGRADRGVPDH